MAEHFPPLSATTLAAANLTGGWLAQNDLATLTAGGAVSVARSFCASQPPVRFAAASVVADSGGKCSAQT
jgi:hypothetical protein